MAVSMGMKVIKYLLFVFNLLFFLIGLGLVVAGALVQTKFRMYFVFFGDQVNVAAIMLIAIGVIIFVVAFFGCIGAYMENHCMLMTFSVLLTIVFILEVSAAIASYLLKNKLKEMITTRMLKTMEDPELEKSWDYMQEKFKCCGANNYTDYKTPEEEIRVPDSCCKSSEDCTNLSEDKIYTTGCAERLFEWAKGHMATISGVALGVAFIEIIGILLACCLGFAISKDGKDYTPM